MEPITQFVFKYATEVNASREEEKPEEIRSLKNIVFDFLNKESADLKGLPVEIQVEYLKRCGSVKKWYDVRHACSSEALNIVSKLVLKNHGFHWIKDSNPFEKLLGHLFEQAIRNPQVTKKEIDQLIEFKRNDQNKVVALKEKTLSVFEHTILRICCVWNYRLNLNQHIRLLNFNLQINVPIVPTLLYAASYAYLNWYFIPRCIEAYQPRGINFLVNHLPARTFPIAFKIYDCVWWFDCLPWIPQRVGNSYPLFYRSFLNVQKGAKLIVNSYKFPVKLAEWGTKLAYRSMDMAVPLLEKAENYSELVRYTRELREVKALWLRESC